jgi:hypothetical protein
MKPETHAGQPFCDVTKGQQCFAEVEVCKKITFEPKIILVVFVYMLRTNNKAVPV